MQFYNVMRLLPSTLSIKQLRIICCCLVLVVVVIGQSITWHNTQLDPLVHDFHDCEHFTACESMTASNVEILTSSHPLLLLNKTSGALVYPAIIISFRVRGPPDLQQNIS